MKWLLLMVGALAASGVVLYRRVRYADHRRPVSKKWLRQLDQLGERVEFHGPSIRKPISKLVNENSWYQTQKLRNRA